MFSDFTGCTRGSSRDTCWSYGERTCSVFSLKGQIFCVFSVKEQPFPSESHSENLWVAAESNCYSSFTKEFELFRVIRHKLTCSASYTLHFYFQELCREIYSSILCILIPSLTASYKTQGKSVSNNL